MSDKYITVSEATALTGLTASQIRYRMEKGLVSYLQDPVTGKRKPMKDDLLKILPQEVIKTSNSI
jgi:DNA-binding transcriptional MerR regulator